MTPNEIARAQEYLRTLFDNNRFVVRPPGSPNTPVEVYLGDEFIAVLDRDEDEGEISYCLNMSILEEDLPPLASM